MYSFSRIPKQVPHVKTDHRLINTVIPAPGTDKILARLDAVEAKSSHTQIPIVWDCAYDYNVADIAGNEFIDFTSSIFVANVGHANAGVVNAVADSLYSNRVHSYAYATEIRTKYLERLTKWSGFDKAFLLSSGTEATEAALKLMRMNGKKVGKKHLGIVCFEGAFHGKTMGAQMISWSEDCARIKQKDREIHYIHFPYPWRNNGTLLPLFDPDDICGFMLETYQGWCAAFYPPDYVKSIERFCHQHNILLCFDEMQSGFGRTGKKFGYEHYGVKPDLICVGKGMGGGLPLSGVLGHADILDLADDLSSTHSANPLCCSAGLAVIDEIEKFDLIKESERKGLILCSELEKITAMFPDRISYVLGNGLVAAVLFQGSNPEEFASRVCERCMQKGVLVVHTGRESIKIGPPLTIPDEALIEGVRVLGESISEIEKEIK